MKVPLERVTFSPGEFAALFGKSQTWGYRQIYAGKVKAITEYGRILIPAAEVEKILGTAGRYNGLERKPARTKAEIQALKPELTDAWLEFIRRKRSGAKWAPTLKKRSPNSADQDPSVRRTALERLASKRK